MPQNPIPSDRETEPERPRRRRLMEISFVQLCAGALAAMTSAVIGSRLGVSGTVIGAAVGSLVAGLTGSIYTASLKHGGHVISRTPLALRVALVLANRELPTAVLPAAGAVPPGAPTRATLEQPAPRTHGARRRRAWRPIAATAAAAFVLAGIGITAVELVSGHSLSGREGTTISQVSAGGELPPPVAARPPADEPTETPTQDAPATETTPSEAPITDESESEDAADTPIEPPSDTPSEAPNQSPDERESEAPIEEPSTPPAEEPSSPAEDLSSPPADEATEPAP